MIKVEKAVGQRGSAGFIFRVVISLKVGVRKRLFDRHSLFRIKGKGPSEKVQREDRSVWEQLTEGFLFLERQSAQIVSAPP